MALTTYVVKIMYYPTNREPHTVGHTVIYPENYP
jgi:hypothetical protein